MKINYILLFLFICHSSLAATWATVVTDKSIVYADAQMTSKVGYLKKGKKVRIGEKSVNKNRVFPFVYQKRVLYIKKIDIQTSDELLALTSAMDRVLKKTINIEPYQKLSLAVGVSAASVESSKSYSSSSNSRSVNLFSFTLGGYYLRPSKRDGFKVSFDYSRGTIEKESLSLLNIDLYYLKRFVNHKRLKVYASTALLVTPLFSYSFGDDFTQNGSGFGASLGLEASYMLTKKVNVDLLFDYRYQSLKVDLPSGLTPSTLEPTLVSPRASIALSYSY